MLATVGAVPVRPACARGAVRLCPCPLMKQTIVSYTTEFYPPSLHVRVSAEHVPRKAGFGSPRAFGIRRESTTERDAVTGRRDKIGGRYGHGETLVGRQSALTARQVQAHSGWTRDDVVPTLPWNRLKLRPLNPCAPMSDVTYQRGALERQRSRRREEVTRTDMGRVATGRRCVPASEPERRLGPKAIHTRARHS